MTPQIRVLIVDDNRDYANSMATILAGRTEVKYDTVVVTNVNEAVNKLKSEKFNVVLLDWLLADGNGEDVIKRAVTKGSDVAVVAISGRGDEDMRAWAKSAGADDFIVKTADPADVSKKLQYAVLYKETEKDKEELSDFMKGVGDLFADAGKMIKSKVDTINEGKGP